MTDIQKARDVLAKWRELAAPGPWRFIKDGPRHVFSAEPFDEVADLTDGRANATLIVSTAGNPELLEAIDRILRDALLIEAGPSLVNNADRLAAAIIAADERMMQ